MLSPDRLWQWDGARWVPAAKGVAIDPPWMRLRVRTPAGRCALVAVLGFGLLADQALRSPGLGLGAAIAIAAAGLLLVVVAPVERRPPRLLAAAAVLFGSWLSLRASPWLAWPDLASGVLLLATAASLAARGSLLDLGLAEVGARIVQGLFQLLFGVPYVAAPLAAARGRLGLLAPVARGLLIALPIAVVLAALLATADPIFASFFQLNLDLGRLALDAFYVALAAFALAGLLRLAASQPLDRVDAPRWRLGLVEGLTVLAVLDTVFAGFAVAQAIGYSSQGYSEYARSGFFQLLWAAGLTLVVLLLFSRITTFTSRRGHLGFVVLAEIAIALTLVVVAVAHQRLSLYEAAYGFTMLRLYSHLFALLVGAVFLLLAAELAGIGRGRRWFAGAASLTALALLLALNVANPESLVVRLNLDRAAATSKLDVGYLVSELSADAVPPLLDGRGRLGPGLQAEVTRAVCAASPTEIPGGAAWNSSADQAANARRAACPSPHK